MPQVLRIIPERRTGKDRRRIFSLHRFFYKGPERRRALHARRLQEERRDGWVRIDKWSSAKLDDLKISKYLDQLESSINFRVFGHLLVKFLAIQKKAPICKVRINRIYFSNERIQRCSKNKTMERDQMDNSSNTDQGIRMLIQKCRKEFRRSENINYYTENDFKEAEKKFLKFCLTGNPKFNSG